MICQIIGLPPISTSGFGRIVVSSPKREPNPPANMTAFIPIGRLRECEYKTQCHKASGDTTLEQINNEEKIIFKMIARQLYSSLYKGVL